MTNATENPSLESRAVQELSALHNTAYAHISPDLEIVETSANFCLVLSASCDSIQGRLVSEIIWEFVGAEAQLLRVLGGKIESYQIVAPTTWNFSPRDAGGTPGALEQALIGAPLRNGEQDPVSVQHIVRSFDPCMVCTVH